MSSTGIKYPGTISTVAESPWLDNNWTSAGNVGAADATYASITASTYDSPDQSYVIKCRGFDFSAIPDSATIDGVVVEFGGMGSAGTGYADLIQLLNTSAAKTGTNKGSTGWNFSSGDVLDEYSVGGATDTWGLSLTPSWIKNSNFGVAFGHQATSANCDILIDYIRMNVYYTTAGGGTVYPKIKVGGSWIAPTAAYVKTGGSWVAVSAIKIKTGGSWTDLV